jgi:hypothetical protein
MPPSGVRLTVDVQAREGARGTTYYAGSVDASSDASP